MILINQRQRCPFFRDPNFGGNLYSVRRLELWIATHGVHMHSVHCTRCLCVCHVFVAKSRRRFCRIYRLLPGRAAFVVAIRSRFLTLTQLDTFIFRGGELSRINKNRTPPTQVTDLRMSFWGFGEA